MGKKKGIAGFGWGTILIVGGLVGSAAAWHFHPPFRRAVCNVGVMGKYFPLCKNEPGYVASENDVPEGYDPALASDLNSQIQMALGGGGPSGSASPPPNYKVTSELARSYAIADRNPFSPGKGWARGRFKQRFPKLKSAR